MVSPPGKPSYKEKLRDILQEREGASLNNFEVFWNIWTILNHFLLYLCLFLTLFFFGYFGLSWTISDILDHLQLYL